MSSKPFVPSEHDTMTISEPYTFSKPTTSDSIAYSGGDDYYTEMSGDTKQDLVDQIVPETAVAENKEEQKAAYVTNLKEKFDAQKAQAQAEVLKSRQNIQDFKDRLAQKVEEKKQQKADADAKAAFPAFEKRKANGKVSRRAMNAHMAAQKNAPVQKAREAKVETPQVKAPEIEIPVIKAPEVKQVAPEVPEIKKPEIAKQQEATVHTPKAKQKRGNIFQRIGNKIKQSLWDNKIVRGLLLTTAVAATFFGSIAKFADVQAKNKAARNKYYAELNKKDEAARQAKEGPQQKVAPQKNLDYGQAVQGLKQETKAATPQVTAPKSETPKPVVAHAEPVETKAQNKAPAATQTTAVRPANQSATANVVPVYTMAQENKNEMLAKPKSYNYTVDSTYTTKSGAVVTQPVLRTAMSDNKADMTQMQQAKNMAFRNRLGNGR